MVMEWIGYKTVVFVIPYTLYKKLCIAVARNSFTIVTELLLARKPKVITARVSTDIPPEIHSTEQGEKSGRRRTHHSLLLNCSTFVHTHTHINSTSEATMRTSNT